MTCSLQGKTVLLRGTTESIGRATAHDDTSGTVHVTDMASDEAQYLCDSVAEITGAQTVA